MPMLPQRRQQSIPSIERRGRGRTPAAETFAEEVEGLAMGVVTETGHGNRHLVKAILYDRMGDNAREELWSLLTTMEEALMEGDRETLLAGFQVIRETLRPQIEKLDRLEDEQYVREAPVHVATARQDGRSIIGICDRMVD